MRAPLDVKVLLALLDTDHVHHEDAKTWLGASINDGWASCALTQNGFVRVVTQPRYPNPTNIGTAMSMLEDACRTQLHEFWCCDISIADPTVIDRSQVLGPHQLTDAYLLALAVAHGGRFVTFDRRVVASAVPGATDEHLVVL